MKYLCVHCDKSFAHSGSKKARCPECMRVNGLERVDDQKAPSPERPWLWWAVGGAVLVAAAIGYSVWESDAVDTVGDDVPMGPLDRSAILGHLRHRGVDARQLETFLVPTDPVTAWAEEAAGDADSPTAKAERLFAAIRDRASEGAFARWSFGVPRETPIVPPEELLEMLAEDDAQHHLYPLETAALMTTGLRALDVTAMVAEAISYAGDRSPPDPSGQIGYYVVAVYSGDEVTGDPTFYDPYSGREAAPDESRVLSDVEALGAGQAHRALHLMSRESDPERALEAIEGSLRLDDSAPAARAVRGAILLVAGRGEDGLDELIAAKQLRSDAPRRNLLASVHMAQRNLDAATREVNAALDQYSEFAPGHATLAAIHLSRQETDEAHTALNEAERIDPDLHILPQLWSNYYVMTGDVDEAVRRARESVERNPDIQSRLNAARIYRTAVRMDLMRREAHAIMAAAPESTHEQYRRLILQVLGATALDPLDDEDEITDEELAALDEEEDLGLRDPSSFTLGSSLLGTEGSGGTGGASLLGMEQLGGGGLGGGGGGGFMLGGGSRSGPSLLDE